MKRPSDVVIPSFKWANLKSIASVPIIVIYKQPKDYPDYYVARVWNSNKPTKIVVIRNTLEDIRLTVPGGFVMIPPSQGDDPVIVETWLG